MGQGRAGKIRRLFRRLVRHGKLFFDDVGKKRCARVSRVVVVEKQRRTVIFDRASAPGAKHRSRRDGSLHKFAVVCDCLLHKTQHTLMVRAADCDFQVHTERQIARQGTRHKHLGFGERSPDEGILFRLVEALQSPCELVRCQNEIGEKRRNCRWLRYASPVLRGA